MRSQAAIKREVHRSACGLGSAGARDRDAGRRQPTGTLVRYAEDLKKALKWLAFFPFLPRRKSHVPRTPFA
jgi:hypothetical protein